MSALLWTTAGNRTRWLPHVQALFDLVPDGDVTNIEPFTFKPIDPVIVTLCAVSYDREHWLIGDCSTYVVTQDDVDHKVNLKFDIGHFRCSIFTLDVQSLTVPVEDL